MFSRHKEPLVSNVYNPDSILIVTLVASCGKHNVMVWHLSVCPVGILTVTHQGAACDAAVVHFGPRIRRTNILV